jgi:hypothetical protein
MTLWLTVGRALLGSLGWFTIIFFLYSPFFIIAFFILGLLAKSYKDHGSKKLLSSFVSQLIVVQAVLVVVYSLFMIDGGDTEDSIGSVATHLFGSSFLDASGIISLIVALAFVAAYLLTLAVAIIERKDS